MNNKTRAKTFHEKSHEHILRNEDEESLEYVNKAIDLEPGNALYLCDAGRTLIKLGRYSEAQAYFERAREADPRELGSIIGLGNCAVGEQDYEKSIDYYDVFIRTAPRRWDGYFFKAVSLASLRRCREALKCIKKCRRRSPPAEIKLKLEALKIKIRFTMGR